MTNAQIIALKSQELMEQGILKPTGRTITVELPTGKFEIAEAEEIHTFAAWKALGYNVKKGEHSEIKFTIWKYTEKKVKEEDKTGNPIEDAPEGKMFMKMSAFFKRSQVEAI